MAGGHRVARSKNVLFFQHLKNAQPAKPFYFWETVSERQNLADLAFLKSIWQPGGGKQSCFTFNFKTKTFRKLFFDIFEKQSRCNLPVLVSSHVKRFF